MGIIINNNGQFKGIKLQKSAQNYPAHKRQLTLNSIYLSVDDPDYIKKCTITD